MNNPDEGAANVVLQDGTEHIRQETESAYALLQRQVMAVLKAEGLESELLAQAVITYRLALSQRGIAVPMPVVLQRLVGLTRQWQNQQTREREAAEAPIRKPPTRKQQLGHKQQVPRNQRRFEKRF